MDWAGSESPGVGVLFARWVERSDGAPAGWGGAGLSPHLKLGIQCLLCVLTLPERLPLGGAKGRCL